MDRVPSTLTAAFSICMVSPLVLNTQWNLRPELGLLTTYVIIVKLRSRPKVEYQGLLQGVFHKILRRVKLKFKDGLHKSLQGRLQGGLSSNLLLGNSKDNTKFIWA